MTPEQEKNGEETRTESGPSTEGAGALETDSPLEDRDARSPYVVPSAEIPAPRLFRNGRGDDIDKYIAAETRKLGEIQGTLREGDRPAVVQAGEAELTDRDLAPAPSSEEPLPND